MNSTAMTRLMRYWPAAIVVWVTIVQFATLVIAEPGGGNHWDGGWGGAPLPLAMLAESSTFGPVLDALGVLAVVAAARLLKGLWQRLTLGVRVGATLYLAGQVANFAYRVASPWIVGDLGVANLWSGGVGNVADLAIASALPAGMIAWAAPHVLAWLREGRWRPGFGGVSGALAGVLLLAGAGGAWATGEASYQAHAQAVQARVRAEARATAAQRRAEAVRRRADLALQQAEVEDDLKLTEIPDGFDWRNPPVMASGGAVSLRPVSGPAELAQLEAKPSNDWVVLVRGLVQTPAMLAWLAIPPWAQAEACRSDLVQEVNPDVVSACMDGFSTGFAPSEVAVQANPPWWLADELAALGRSGS